MSDDSYLDQLEDRQAARASTWSWTCATCGHPTLEPHTGPDDEDLCPWCCTACATGETAAALEQQLKEHTGLGTNPGDPVVGHGIPTREQAATGEASRWSSRMEPRHEVAVICLDDHDPPSWSRHGQVDPRADDVPSPPLDDERSDCRCRSMQPDSHKIGFETPQRTHSSLDGRRRMQVPGAQLDRVEERVDQAEANATLVDLDDLHSDLSAVQPPRRRDVPDRRYDETDDRDDQRPVGPLQFSQYHGAGGYVAPVARAPKEPT